MRLCWRTRTVARTGIRLALRFLESCVSTEHSGSIGCTEWRLLVLVFSGARASECVCVCKHGCIFHSHRALFAVWMADRWHTYPHLQPRSSINAQEPPTFTLRQERRHDGGVSPALHSPTRCPVYFWCLPRAPLGHGI